jgi:hypothetical protein
VNHIFLVGIVKDEVQNANGVDRLQAKIPVAFLSLLLNREAGIVDTAIFEVILLGFLQLNNKIRAVRGFAVQVKNRLAI